jgi:hypothetical protein
LVSIVVVHHWGRGIVDLRGMLRWKTRRRCTLTWLQDVGIRAVLTKMDWLVGKGEAVGHSDGVGIMAIAKVPSSSLGAAEV